MSMIFGIFNRNGEPVSENDIKSMYDSVSYFPHESYNSKIINNVGFGHMLTYNTPESLYETQPFYLENKKILFVFKGRIDNRKDLADRLNISISDKTPDGDIAFQTFLKYREKGSDLINGDWACAMFDYETQELIVSRDHHGYTAIHYYYDDKQIIFSSSIKSILELDSINKDINENIIIRTLAIWNKSDKDISTYYKNIYILGPAKYIKADRDQFKAQRYWYPENIQINNSKNISEYAEEFYKIFEDAVRVRLRSYKPVASMLSGGLDSGSVSFIAAQLMKEQNKKLTTYSHIPLYEVSNNIGQLRFGDETPYINATVEASGNINPIYLRSENVGVLEGLLSFINNFNTCIHAGANAYWLVDIMKTSSDSGFGTLLTGEHGNATISFTGLEESLNTFETYNKFGLKRTIKKKLLKPVFKKYLPNQFNKIKNGGSYSLESYSYINPILFYDIKQKMKKEGHDHKFIFNFKSHQQLLLKILLPGSNPRCYFGGINSDFYGIEKRDPTADKNVVEYALSIPNKIFFSSNGKPKEVIKYMMKNKLPDKVLFTDKKGLQSADIGLRVKKEKDKINDIINKLYNSPEVNEFIDTRKLKTDFVEEMLTKKNNFNTLTLNNILRTVMIGEFIYNNRG